MTNWKKRLTALLLAFSLLIGCTALAEDEEEWSLLDWDEDDEEEQAPALPDFEAEDFDWDAWLEEAEADEAVQSVEQVDIDEAVNTADLEINENLPDHVINIMLIGIDSHVKDVHEEKASHLNDSNMILSINTEDGSIKLTSILRDLYVEIPGYRNRAKLNNAYYRGEGDLVMRTINHNFEMNIQYYVVINFYGVAAIVDSLGGIDIDMTRTEARAINAYLRNAYKKKRLYTYDTKDPSERTELEEAAGWHHCDGIQALMYARLRKIDNDFQRSYRQRHLLELLLQAVMQDMDSEKALNLITTCLPYMITNMNINTVLSIASQVLQTNIAQKARSGEELLEQHRLPLDRTYNYLTLDSGSTVTNLSETGWKSNRESLHYFIYGDYYPAH